MQPVLKDLVARMPLLDGRLDDDARIDEFTAAERYMLGAWARTVVDDLPDDLLAACPTVGDLGDWVTNAESHGRFHPGRRHRRSTLAGDGLALRPIRPEHLPHLYQAAFSGERSWKWRFRGRTVPYESFVGMMNEGVYAQFAVETSANPPVLLGLLSAYDADTAAGHCYVAFHNTGVDHPIRGRMIGAMVGFLDYLFYVAPFRKLYVDVPEYNIGVFDGFQDSLLVEEGRLHDHFFLGGRFHDRVIFAIYREAFELISDAWYE